MRGGKISFLLFKGLLELSPNRLFEHLENNSIFVISKIGTTLYYKVNLNPAILLLESKHVAVYTQHKAILRSQHKNQRVSVKHFALKVCRFKKKSGEIPVVL